MKEEKKKRVVLLRGTWGAMSLFEVEDEASNLTWLGTEILYIGMGHSTTWESVAYGVLHKDGWKVVLDSEEWR